MWQKIWTIIIIGALNAIESCTNIQSSIMGQGDNQVTLITWEIPYEDVDAEEYAKHYEASFNEKLDLYFFHLRRLMRGLGMKVTVEKTLLSTKFMSYGKEGFF